MKGKYTKVRNNMNQIKNTNKMYVYSMKNPVWSELIYIIDEYDLSNMNFGC